MHTNYIFKDILINLFAHQTEKVNSIRIVNLLPPRYVEELDWYYFN